MKLRWTFNLSIGVVWIDEQNRKLFDRINYLLDTLENAEDIPVIDSAFTLLEEHIKSHFNIESNYMLQYKYPRQKQHLIQHIAHEIELNEIKKKIKNEGISLDLIGRVRNNISDWWEYHIENYDKDFGGYLKNRSYLKKNVKQLYLSSEITKHNDFI